MVEPLARVVAEQFIGCEVVNILTWGGIYYCHLPLVKWRLRWKEEVRVLHCFLTGFEEQAFLKTVKHGEKAISFENFYAQVCRWELEVALHVGHKYREFWRFRVSE
jgi:hypothetical protein